MSYWSKTALNGGRIFLILKFICYLADKETDMLIVSVSQSFYSNAFAFHYAETSFKIAIKLRSYYI